MLEGDGFLNIPSHLCKAPPFKAMLHVIYLLYFKLCIVLKFYSVVNYTTYIFRNQKEFKNVVDGANAAEYFYKQKCSDEQRDRKVYSSTSKDNN